MPRSTSVQSHYAALQLAHSSHGRAPIDASSPDPPQRSGLRQGETSSFELEAGLDDATAARLATRSSFSPASSPRDSETSWIPTAAWRSSAPKCCAVSRSTSSLAAASWDRGGCCARGTLGAVACDVPTAARAELFRDAVRRGRVPLRQAANIAKPISCNYEPRNFNIASIELALGPTLLFVGAWSTPHGGSTVICTMEPQTSSAATPAALPGIVGCSSVPLASCCPGPRDLRHLPLAQNPLQVPSTTDSL